MEDIKNDSFDISEEKHNNGMQWFFTLLLVVLAVVIVFLVINNSPDKKTDTTSAPQTPENVVSGFYSFWLSYYENEGASPVSDMAYRDSQNVTEDFIQKTDSVIESFGDRIAFDPITCRRAIPQNISLETIYQDETSSNVLINTSFNDSITRQIMVSLKKQNDDWKIDDIDCNPLL